MCELSRCVAEREAGSSGVRSTLSKEKKVGADACAVVELATPASTQIG